MTRTKAISFLAALILALAVIGAALANTGGDGAAGAPSTGASRTTAAPLTTEPQLGTGATTTAVAVPEASPADADGDAGRPVRDTDPADRPPVHEVITGSQGTPPPAGPGDLIGELGDGGPIPAGLGLAIPPKKPAKPNGLGGPGSLAAAPSCAHQCITSGKAFPRGFGAELVVETSVPTTVFFSAVADLDGDGVFEDAHQAWSQQQQQVHSGAFDHLAPGTTYHAMAAATDGDGHTAYAWGTFTTLAHRDVFVELGDLTVDGGPGNVTKTSWKLGVDGPLVNATPGEQGILLYKDLDRNIDLDFWVVRSWHEKICEVWLPQADQPHGHDDASCLAWNSTSVDVDLDQAPAGETRWTATTVQLTLHQPTGNPGDALPPGYGDPYWFAFSVPVTLHVMYH